MARAHKFTGGGRMGDTMGSVPAETRQPYMPSGRGKTLRASVSRQTAPGRPAATSQGESSHNSISTFLKGARSRGPYGGPTFASLNNVEKNYKMSTPSSKFDLPSGR